VFMGDVGSLSLGGILGTIAVIAKHKEASDFLRENTRPGDCLLFKGSRGSGMEKVLKELIHPEAD